jgi:predicted kinase
MKATLFVTLGYPGSGKTYFAERFAKDLELMHLNADRLRLEMFEDPKHTPAEHKRVFAVMDYITDHLLAAGISLVYDANVTKREYRGKLRQIAKKHKANYLLVHIETPVNLAESRLEDRRKIKSKEKKMDYRPIEDEVQGIPKSTESPLPSEPHVTIDGTKPYKEQLAQLKLSLKLQAKNKRFKNA